MITVREHMTLRIAGATYTYPAARENDALDLVGYTPARFAQVVLALIDRPDVEAAYPQLAHRMRRLRARRAQARSGPRLATAMASVDAG